MDAAAVEPLDPWLAIWTRPRETIRYIVSTDPDRMVLPLVAIAGVGEALNRASAESMGDTVSLPLIFLIALVVGPIGGIVGLYIGSALLAWTGGWIGGSAPIGHIRAAMAWAGVPFITSMGLWVPELALFGEELFTTATPRIDAVPLLALTLLGLALIEVTLGVWSFVVFLKTLGEVQGFSAWKALGNAFLAGMVIIVPIVAFVLLVWGVAG